MVTKDICNVAPRAPPMLEFSARMSRKQMPSWLRTLRIPTAKISTLAGKARYNSPRVAQVLDCCDAQGRAQASLFAYCQ